MTTNCNDSLEPSSNIHKNKQNKFSLYLNVGNSDQNQAGTSHTITFLQDEFHLTKNIEQAAFASIRCSNDGNMDSCSQPFSSSSILQMLLHFINQYPDFLFHW